MDCAKKSFFLIFQIWLLLGALGCAIHENSAPFSFSTFADGFTPARFLWVDVNFNSSGLTPGDHPGLFYAGVYIGDGTEAYPFTNIHQTVSDVDNSARPGTRINVRQGIYGDWGTTYVLYEGNYTGVRDTANDIVFRCAGTAAAPIMLYSIDGPGAAIIDGISDGDDQGNGLVLIQNNDYVIIDGFVIRNCQQNVYVGANYGTGFLIRNCHVHDAITGDCIKASQMNGVYIENCVVHDPGLRVDGVSRQEPIDFVAVRGGHVINTEAYNGDFGMYAKGGSRNIVFWGNYVHNFRYTGIALGGFTGAGYFYNAIDNPNDDQYELYNGYAYNNVIAEVGQCGIEFIGCIDSAAEFNTIWNCAQDSLTETWDEPVMVRPGNTATYWYNSGVECSVPRNIVFRNNVVANPDGGMLYPFRSNDQGCGVRADPGDITVSHNLWWNQGSSLTDGDPISHIPILGEAHSLYNLDPLLSAAEVPFLRPQAGSPLAGRGLKNANIAVDYEGKVRGMPPAPGAFEFP